MLRLSAMRNECQFVSVRSQRSQRWDWGLTAPWAFIWFLDGNENKVDISIVGTNGKFFLINAHGVLRRMGAATEIPGSSSKCTFVITS